MVSFSLVFGLICICAYHCDAAPSHPEVLNQEAVEQTSLDQGLYLSKEVEPPFETNQKKTDEEIHVGEPFIGEYSANKDGSHTFYSDDEPATPPRPIYQKEVIVY